MGQHGHIPECVTYPKIGAGKYKFLASVGACGTLGYWPVIHNVGIGVKGSHLSGAVSCRGVHVVIIPVHTITNFVFVSLVHH